MPLNDRQIRNLKPTATIRKLSDGGGLALVCKPNGGKYWHLNFRFNGKQKTLSIGTYPTVSLAEARQAAENARRLLAQGQDPAAAKQQAKQERQAALLNTFAAVACRWHTDNLPRWKPNHAGRIMRYFETDVFPLIGETPIAELRVRDIKAVIDSVAARGVVETAEKIRQWINSICNYAAMLEIIDGNPAAPLAGYLKKPDTAHMPALPREELAEFYRRLLLADTEPQHRIGILLLMLVFVRNKELRGAQWREFDLKQKQWLIPAERMKRPRAHLVPLADWTMELLAELHTITGHSDFLFPSRTATGGYISENTFGKIINGMGYKGIATPHGFRSLASSVLNEQGFDENAIERQLAHVEDNKIKAAYNRAEYWPHRVAFMQWYADYLRGHYEQARTLNGGVHR